MDTIFIILFILNLLCGIVNTRIGIESSDSFRAWLAVCNWIAVGALTDNIIRAFQ